jgi:hypothetical protein
MYFAVYLNRLSPFSVVLILGEIAILSVLSTVVSFTLVFHILLPSYKDIILEQLLLCCQHRFIVHYHWPTSIVLNGLHPLIKGIRITIQPQATAIVHYLSPFQALDVLANVPLAYAFFSSESLRTENRK